MDPEDEKPSIDRLIDANLKQIYDSVLKQDVPDEFSELLRKLRDAEVADRTGEDGSEGQD